MVPITKGMGASVLATSPATTGADVNDAVHDSLCLLAELYEYNHWTFNRLRRFLGDNVCDIGCGNGNFIRFVLDRTRVVGLEPYRPTFDAAVARFRHHANVELVCDTLAHCPGERLPVESFDSVVCMRLLDSLEDDVESLAIMRRLCRAGGHVIIVASAHMSAYGELDRAVGHQRRYNRRSLRQRFEAAGLRAVYSTYLNWPGYFGWLLNSRILKRRTIPSRSARFANRLAPYIDVLERLVPPPFGQSILMVGTPA